MNWLLLLPVNEKSRCWTNRRGEPPTKYHVCRRFRLYGNTDHAQYIRSKAHISILPARELEHEYGRELRSHFGGIRQQIRFSGDTRQRILTCLRHAMHEGWSLIVSTIFQMQGGITLARGILSDAALSHSPAREYCAPSPAWEILEDPFLRPVLFLACQQALLVCATLLRGSTHPLLPQLSWPWSEAHPNMIGSWPAMKENDKAIV